MISTIVLLGKQLKNCYVGDIYNDGNIRFRNLVYPRVYDYKGSQCYESVQHLNSHSANKLENNFSAISKCVLHNFITTCISYAKEYWNNL